MSSSVEHFIRNVAVPPIVRIVLSGEARDARICVTADADKFQWPVWVEVMKTTIKDRGDIEGLHARTNDMDFMVGYPPSFFDTQSLEDADKLIESICNFLLEKLANATRVEVKLLASPVPGGPALPTLIGASDADTLREQPEFPSL